MGKREQPLGGAGKLNKTGDQPCLALKRGSVLLIT
jgi:hypothetical protein